jgi:steroid 5-alpha reductase family enzyme
VQSDLKQGMIMAEPTIHTTLIFVTFGLAVITAMALLFVTAPYGRHVRKGWGPTIPSRIGWIVMEMPAVAIFTALFVFGDNSAQLMPLILLGIWQVHYIHRTLIFPFRMRSKGRRMPILVMLLAIVFNTLNAYINARWISHLGTYADGWLTDPRFIAGAALFVIGFMINIRADSKLFRLRRSGDTVYKIPRGGLYEKISCPNYFGEILEWVGWAIATWSLAGLSFAIYTIANLAPRAFAHHRWYRETFPEYPKQRKALVPYLW